jgi:hypothetical protein
MRPAAQAVAVFAVGAIAVGHQPAGKIGADAAPQQRLGAAADEEQRRVGAGDDPQPKACPGLVVRGLVGMQQLGLQDLLLNLWRDRCAGVGRFVDGLGDGAGREGEPEQFPGELLAAAYR